MSDDHDLDQTDAATLQEILSGSGYSQKAIDYYLDKPSMGSIADADQVTELTGPCGDTMKVYLKVNDSQISDAKIQVLGCPGAVSAAMVAMELAKGKTLDDAYDIKDRDIYRILEQLPEQKQHCIRLAVKTLQKAIQEYKVNNNGHHREEQ
jgi:nitrogen fixation protein NifU and related proteins